MALIIFLNNTCSKQLVSNSSNKICLHTVFGLCQEKSVGVLPSILWALDKAFIKHFKIMCTLISKSSLFTDTS